jgi:hypothetical protein
MSVPVVATAAEPWLVAKASKRAGAACFPERFASSYTRFLPTVEGSLVLTPSFRHNFHESAFFVLGECYGAASAAQLLEPSIIYHHVMHVFGYIDGLFLQAKSKQGLYQYLSTG